jgi:hypothetical protein
MERSLVSTPAYLLGPLHLWEIMQQTTAVKSATSVESFATDETGSKQTLGMAIASLTAPFGHAGPSAHT